MDKHTEKVYQRLLSRDYRNLRSDIVIDISDLINDKDLSLPLRISRRLLRMAENETPLLFKDDRIGFIRTIKKVPDPLSEEEYQLLSKDYLLFDRGGVGNISSDYSYTLSVGFNKRLQEIEDGLSLATSKKEHDELLAMKESILAMYILVEKYQKKAEEIGNATLSKILKVIPYNAPSSYHEALVFFRIMNYMLWLNSNKHNTLGRFDQYMYPFFIKDIENNVITYEEAKNLTEELFIQLNFDADLYPGIQQGDNGQSIVLGGVKRNGEDAFNLLTKLCLEASLENKLIDPKINLRVNKDTDLKWFRLGTLLTKQGLGFPQYSNDDVVIPALVKWGYDLEDARDYVVAACWEFIIPGVGMEIPNIDALNYPLVVDKALHSPLFKDIETFDEFLNLVHENLSQEITRLVNYSKNVFLIPSPYQSILMNDCVKNKKDIADGSKYNNFGFHGAGLSNASDALAAIKLHIFEKKDITKEQLLKALEDNFEGHTLIHKQLLNAPKMGNNDDYVDDLACDLVNCFAKECSKHKNTRNGIYRAGTGTAMYYIWYSENMGATADGRKKGEPFSANYSPSLSHNFKGVLSVIQSFTKPDLTKVCNGGPLTLEFHDTLFRNDDGIEKVAMLIKTFIALKGHQLQLNAINRETLLDAQIHPEDHKNLIVRVWGWSGYFNELDLVYQNHIIKRLEFLN